MEQTGNPKISSFILHCYRHFLNGNNESIEKLGTEDLKIPRFNENDLIDLCDSAIYTLKQINKTLLYLPSPSIVIGDLHGNLHDLIRLMNSIIDIFSNRVLFLGDYIDRGQFQLETITILFALRIEYPDHFFMIRGNHEFASVNAYGGFKDEIINSGYSETLFNKINEVFSWLPIAAVINDHIFCVHGGLSPLFHEIKQIETEFKLPIKNIYTNSSDSYKKRSKLSDSSSSRAANMSMRSSLTNVNANLNVNVTFFQSARTKPRLSDSSEFKTAALSVKTSLQNLKEPNINSNLKSHPPKFLPLCKRSNYELPINKKLPSIGTKSPLPSLPDVKTSISPSTNVNSELENSIANFSNQNSNSIQPSSVQPQPKPIQNSISALPITNSNISIQNNDSTSSNSTSLLSSPTSPLPNITSPSQNQISPLQLPISPSPKTSAFYISSSQLEMITKYKETVLAENESCEDVLNNTELLTDLMWSDPTNSCELFLPSNRGSGCYFGFVITNTFLKKNGMKMIVRGHESIKKGIETNHEKKVVTIYSSSSLRQGGIAGCAIFDSDGTYEEFRLFPINFVQRCDAKFYAPTIKMNNNNKPLKLNSFSQSQSIFVNVKKLRKNSKGMHTQSLSSSPNYNNSESILSGIYTIKEEEGECF